MNEMFCFQCEQTANCSGCTGRAGVCGKSAATEAPDAEAFHSAFKEYSASLLNKDKRPSVLAKLHKLVQAAAELPGKVRHKEQERGL